ncbi:MAG TPA: amidohydrolase family protein [Vicinamibacterales bacterium]|nr:amidohydrolase family protein [Vicinamibacterales bacterium]
MKPNVRLGAGALVIAAALAVGASADAPHVYAIKGARIVPVSGAAIASGTVVVRNGLIEAVGAAVEAPADAQVIEGKGLTVYPGLIDMANSAGLDLQINRQQPAGLRTTEEAERWKRELILTPAVNAADHLQGGPDLARLASAGITSVLSTPPGVIVKGRSALVNVAAPVDEPAIGNVGDYRTGVQVVRSPVALHIEFPGGVGGDAYPNSLLGVISFVRQSFLDAQHQHAVAQRAAKSAAVRPPYDPSLDALQPALEGRLPVAFEANTSREILRALELANEFKLDPMISGGREADQVAADLKARNVRVIYNLNYPTRSRTLAPDADESISVLRARANAPKVPAALDKAGVVFAFSAAGLREPRDFVRNAARAVREGLPAEAALRALTLNAARIAGADSRVGSIEKGRIANLLVTNGDLFDDDTEVKHVFVDGRMVILEAPAPQRGGRGRGSGF